jgi:hypothetical protein
MVQLALQDRLFPGLSCLTHLRLHGSFDLQNDNGFDSCCMQQISTRQPAGTVPGQHRWGQVLVSAACNVLLGDR